MPETVNLCWLLYRWLAQPFGCSVYGAACALKSKGRGSRELHHSKRFTTDSGRKQPIFGLPSHAGRNRLRASPSYLSEHVSEAPRRPAEPQAHRSEAIMQIIVDGVPQAKISMSCSGCVYLSQLGRCQRVKSKFYSFEIAHPEAFGCARWERADGGMKPEIRKA